MKNTVAVRRVNMGPALPVLYVYAIHVATAVTAITNNRFK